MDISTFIGAMLGLLFLGAIVMTQLPRSWHTLTGWAFISLAGIPLFGMAIAIMVKVPILLFGVIAWACFEAGRSNRWRR
ncbi:hypothetical protein ACYCFK_17915 [Stutzerimonas stutzeri]